VAKGVEHARGQLVLAVGGGSTLDGALVVGQLLVEQKGVVPLKWSAGHEEFPEKVIL
jgi:alcohol dehydrogenase class IV